mgnify:CR=1 FL=1
MEAVGREHKDGMQWILGAGLVAELIAAFVAWSDRALSTSTGEQRLADTLRELRTAQPSLPSGNIDSRQGHRVVMREPPAPAVLAAGRTQLAHGEEQHGGTAHGAVQGSGHAAPSAGH